MTSSQKSLILDLLREEQEALLREIDSGDLTPSEIDEARDRLELVKETGQVVVGC